MTGRCELAGAELVRLRPAERVQRGGVVCPRARWERGDCPCCGYGPLRPFVAQEVIAEGVRVCAPCAVPGHLRDGAGWEPLLLALVAAPSRAPG